MSLVADYSSDSSGDTFDDFSSSSDSESLESFKLPVKLEKKWTAPLPSPNLNHSSSVRGVSSVFNNPFEEAKKAEVAVLEKHVKLAPSLSEMDGMINGQKICWMYKKGRCRFGSQCKYLHGVDSQFIKPKEDTTEEDTNTEYVEQTNKKRKSKRAGITDNVVPPKKALKLYKKVQNKAKE